MAESSSEGISRGSAILRGLCPRCRRGHIFRRSLWLGLPPAHEHCPECGLQFEREQGYWLGAMYISYTLAVPLMTLFVLLFWAFTTWSVQKLVLAAAIALIPFVPLITVYSRVIWLHFDRTIDPDRE